MKPIYKWSIALIIVVLFVWQYRKKNVADIDFVKLEVDKIIQYEKSQQDIKCKQEAFDIANHIVDSILIASSLQTSFDTTGRPAPPQRPVKPNMNSTIDDVPLRPLFEKK